MSNGPGALIVNALPAWLLAIEMLPLRSPVRPTFLIVSFAVDDAPTPIPTGLMLSLDGTATIFAPVGVAIAVGVAVGVAPVVAVAVGVAPPVPVAVGVAPEVPVAVGPAGGPSFDTKPLENPS
jgi:hypothetical protein